MYFIFSDTCCFVSHLIYCSEGRLVASLAFKSLIYSIAYNAKYLNDIIKKIILTIIHNINKGGIQKFLLNRLVE